MARKRSPRNRRRVRYVERYDQEAVDLACGRQVALEEFGWISREDADDPPTVLVEWDLGGSCWMLLGGEVELLVKPRAPLLPA